MEKDASLGLWNATDKITQRVSSGSILEPEITWPLMWTIFDEPNTNLLVAASGTIVFFQYLGGLSTTSYGSNIFWS